MKKYVWILGLALICGIAGTAVAKPAPNPCAGKFIPIKCAFDYRAEYTDNFLINEHRAVKYHRRCQYVAADTLSPAECKEAVAIIAATAEELQKSQNTENDRLCEETCGKGFHYDRPGDRQNGAEKICTRYQKKCQEKCVTGWDIKYLIENSNFTCQDAIQK